jgi:hypothetical protein
LWVTPRYEDAAEALNEMHGGGLRGRIVLMVA